MLKGFNICSELRRRTVNHFKEEVIQIYKKYINFVASTSSNRKAYQAVCHKIMRYGKIAGKEEQVELIKGLKALYKRKRAQRTKGTDP